MVPSPLFMIDPIFSIHSIYIMYNPFHLYMYNENILCFHLNVWPWTYCRNIYDTTKFLHFLNFNRSRQLIEHARMFVKNYEAYRASL